MTEYVLTDAQRRGLAVFVAAEMTRPRRRPVRISERTTSDTSRREMLHVHHKVADALVAAGLVRVTNDVLRTLELTDAGRQLARETGLG